MGLRTLPSDEPDFSTKRREIEKTLENSIDSAVIRLLRCRILIDVILHFGLFNRYFGKAAPDPQPVVIGWVTTASRARIFVNVIENMILE